MSIVGESLSLTVIKCVSGNKFAFNTRWLVSNGHSGQSEVSGQSHGRDVMFMVVADTSRDSCRLLADCCQPDHSFIHRLLFPLPDVTGSDVTPTPPTSRSHRQTALSCSSRASVIRF